MLTERPGTTLIGRLRLVTRGDDRADQSRVAGLLAASEFRPPGLPPAALLCVRTLRAPSVRWIDLQAGGRRPPAAWEQTVSAELARAVGLAVRPGHQQVPAAAPAVLFADEAELLASLAEDWCAGELAVHWWWRPFLRDASPAEVVIHTWLEEAQHAPAALEQLARRGWAETFVRRLPTGVALALCRRAVEAHGVPDLLSALGSLSAVHRTASLVTHAARTSQSGPDSLDTEIPSGREHGPSQPAPWAAWVPKTQAGGLTLEQQVLLGIGLELRRAPVEVRQPAFAKAVTVWTRDEIRDVGSAAQLDSKTAPAAATGMVDDLARWPGIETHDLPVASRLKPAGSGAPDAALGEAGGVAIPPEVETRRLVDQSRLQPADVGASDVALGRAGGVANPPGLEIRRRADQSRLKLADAEAPDVASGKAGDAASPLGVVPQGCPARTRRLADQSRLQPADGGAPDLALGEAGGVANPPGVETRRLADQSRLQPAGTGSAGEREPTLLPPLAISIVTDLGGLFYLVNLGLYLGLYGDFTTPLTPGIALSLWDFMVLVGRDLVGETLESDSLEGDPIWDLLARLSGRSVDEAPGAGFEPPADWRMPEEWLAAIGENPREGLQKHKMPGDQSPAATGGLESWLASVLPCIRVRLCRALGLKSASDLAGMLLRRRARVYVTPSHVDVMLSLAELPIEVRLAGLDRDPGWVPAAGRAVAFHFE